MTDRTDAVAAQRVDAGTVRRLCGDILDWKVAAIVGTGATVADLEIAVAWMNGESDAMGEARLPLSGVAAEVYDLLIAEEDFAEER